MEAGRIQEDFAVRLFFIFLISCLQIKRVYMHKHMDTFLHLPAVTLCLNPKHATIKLPDTGGMSFLWLEREKKLLFVQSFIALK